MRWLCILKHRWRVTHRGMAWYGMGLDPTEFLQCKRCGVTAERPVGYPHDIFVHDKE